MLALPLTFSSVIGVFAPVFSRPVWQHVKVLLTGAAPAYGTQCGPRLSDVSSGP